MDLEEAMQECTTTTRRVKGVVMKVSTRAIDLAEESILSKWLDLAVARKKTRGDGLAGSTPGQKRAVLMARNDGWTGIVRQPERDRWWFGIGFPMAMGEMAAPGGRGT